MEHDLEVTGHPLVNLWVSSSAGDGDFFAYLDDVDEKGDALLMSEGRLRTGFAHLYDNNEMIHSGDLGIEVLPRLPWHGYEKAEYVAGILAGNRAVELTLDLMRRAPCRLVAQGDAGRRDGLAAQEEINDL